MATPSVHSGVSRRSFHSPSPGAVEPRGWLQDMGRHVLNVDVTALGGAPVKASVEMTELPSLSIVGFELSPLTMSRAARHLDDGYDGLALSVPFLGTAFARQGSHDFTVAAGEAILLDARRPSDLANTDAMSFVGFKLSRRWFAERGFALMTEHPLPLQRSVALKLLIEYAMAVVTHGADGHLANVYDLHISELITAALMDASGVASAQPVILRDARYRLIAQAIRRRATEPSFSLVDLARDIAHSERTIQAALGRHGESFSSLLRNERLAIAHGLLQSGRGGPIAAIAFAAGFQDLSTFNRAFRERFGMQPRDLLALSRPGG
jgi:AraC-like DNA-binding protein